MIEEREREDALVRLMEEQSPEKTMVFCRTRMEVDELTSVLCARGYTAKSLHGDMEQPMRNKVMSGFKRGDFDLLVATDVASRGLDVEDVSHVFNYHIPFNSKSYIHRIGRTGRAGKKGIAITLATPREYSQIGRIQQHTGSTMEATQVPRLSALRKSRLARLQEQLANVKMVPESLELAKALEEEMAPEELCMRLVSLILADQQESGPDRIGLSAEAVDRLGSRPLRRDNKYGGRKPRYGGGPRGGGSGGGYRRKYKGGGKPRG